jgi:hypothetical protein
MSGLGALSQFWISHLRLSLRPKEECIFSIPIFFLILSLFHSICKTSFLHQNTVAAQLEIAQIFSMLKKVNSNKYYS